MPLIYHFLIAPIGSDGFLVSKEASNASYLSPALPDFWLTILGSSQKRQVVPLIYHITAVSWASTPPGLKALFSRGCIFLLQTVLPCRRNSRQPRLDARARGPQDISVTGSLERPRRDRAAIWPSQALRASSRGAEACRDAVRSLPPRAPSAGRRESLAIATTRPAVPIRH